MNVHVPEPSNPYDAPRSDLRPPVTDREGADRPRWAFVGPMMGPLAAILFSVARVGPRGLLWFEGKGGETVLTPKGRIVVVVVTIAVAFAGALCGIVLDVRCRNIRRKPVLSESRSSD